MTRSILAVALLLALLVPAWSCAQPSDDPASGFDGLSATASPPAPAVQSQDVAKLMFEFLKEPTRESWLKIQRDVRSLKGTLEDSEKRVLYSLLAQYATALWLRDHPEDLTLVPQSAPAAAAPAQLQAAEAPASDAILTAMGRGRNLMMARRAAEMRMQAMVAQALNGAQETRNADGSVTRTVSGTVTYQDYEIVGRTQSEQNGMVTETIKFRVRRR